MRLSRGILAYQSANKCNNGGWRATHPIILDGWYGMRIIVFFALLKGDSHCVSPLFAFVDAADCSTEKGRCIHDVGRPTD